MAQHRRRTGGQVLVDQLLAQGVELGGLLVHLRAGLGHLRHAVVQGVEEVVEQQFLFGRDFFLPEYENFGRIQARVQQGRILFVQHLNFQHLRRYLPAGAVHYVGSGTVALLQPVQGLGRGRRQQRASADGRHPSPASIHRPYREQARDEASRALRAALEADVSKERAFAILAKWLKPSGNSMKVAHQCLWAWPANSCSTSIPRTNPT